MRAELGSAGAGRRVARSAAPAPARGTMPRGEPHERGAYATLEYAAGAALHPTQSDAPESRMSLISRTGGEILVANLLAQGVTHAFCVPGESYLAVLDALY